MLLFSALLAAVDDRSAFESKLRSSLQNTTIMFLTPYQGSDLHFGADGAPKFNVTPASWLMNSLFSVHEVKLDGNEPQLEGERAMMLYEPKEHTLVPVSLGRKLKVTIDLDPSQPAEPQVSFAIHKLFYTSGLKDLLSNYWKPAMPEGVDVSVWSKGHAGEVAGTLRSRNVYFVKAGVVKPPKPVKLRDPKYDEEARRAKVTGTTLLFAIINEQGDPEVLGFQRPLGNVLDVKALEAVAGWKFKPALRQGQPVPVEINVEVNFRLY